MNKIKLRVELVKTTSPPFHQYDVFNGDEWLAEFSLIDYKEYGVDFGDFIADTLTQAELKQAIALLEAIADELEKLNKEIK